MFSQQQRKRSNDDGTVPGPIKRARTMKWVTCRKGQRAEENLSKEQEDLEVEIQPPAVIMEEPLPPPTEHADNVPQNQQTSLENAEEVTATLEQSGTDSDSTSSSSQQTVIYVGRDHTETNGSEDSETTLVNVDRTKMSLGDSDDTAASLRIIRNEWGIEGTMTKIIHMIKRGTDHITVESLIANGPHLSGYKNAIKTKCFVSILKLYQHGYIKLIKNPETLEIIDIILGPKMFD